MIYITAKFRTGGKCVTAAVPFNEIPQVGHVVLIEPSTELISEGVARRVSVDSGAYEVTEVLWHQPKGRNGFVPLVELNKP